MSGSVDGSRLAGVPLFGSCSDEERQVIVDLGVPITVSEGKNVVEQSKYGQHAYVILEGSADVIRHGEVINTLARGDAFGELSLLYNGPRSATVRATSRLEMLQIERPQFTDLLAQYPSITHHLLEVMAERLLAIDQDVYG